MTSLYNCSVLTKYIICERYGLISICQAKYIFILGQERHSGQLSVNQVFYRTHSLAQSLITLLTTTPYPHMSACMPTLQRHKHSNTHPQRVLQTSFLSISQYLLVTQPLFPKQKFSLLQERKLQRSWTISVIQFHNTWQEKRFVPLVNNAAI